MHCGVGEYTRFLTFSLKSIAPWIEVKIFTSTRLGKNLWKDPLGNDVILNIRLLLLLDCMHIFVFSHDVGL